MIRVNSSGNFDKTRSFIERIINRGIYQNFDTYGRMGVDALANATPVDTGLTAQSWGYRVIKDRVNPGIEWFNTNTVNGTSVAILLQYGHGTGTGGYVVGHDFINPAIVPVFDRIQEAVWREVTA